MANHSPCRPAAIWVSACAFCTCAGWGLSAVHGLNATGYLLAFAAGLAAFLVWNKRTGAPMLRLPTWSRLRRRFGRPLPLCFLPLSTLAFLGGALYAPANWDALAYRV